MTIRANIVPELSILSQFHARISALPNVPSTQLLRGGRRTVATIRLACDGGLVRAETLFVRSDCYETYFRPPNRRRIGDTPAR